MADTTPRNRSRSPVGSSPTANGGPPAAADTLGDLIRSGRRGKGLSLRKTAELAAISLAYLQRLEADSIGDPSPRILERLGRTVDVDVNHLMRAAGYPAASLVGALSREMRPAAEALERALDEQGVLYIAAPMLAISSRERRQPAFIVYPRPGEQALVVDILPKLAVAAWAESRQRRERAFWRECGFDYLGVEVSRCLTDSTLTAASIAARSPSRNPLPK